MARKFVLFACAAIWLAGGRTFGAAMPQGPDNAAKASTPASDQQADEDQKRDAKPAKGQLKANAKAQDDEFSPTYQRGLKNLGADFLDDQRQIWTSPAKLRFSDSQWLLPSIGITAGLFVTDKDYSRHISQDPQRVSRYSTLSTAGTAALAGGAGGMWLLGHIKHNEHWSETGLLAGEAALNSLVVVESLKYSLRRGRPDQGDGSGSFFQSGGNSFPSEHSAIVWSVAGVVTHEYPGPLTKFFAYSLATLVDFSRVHSRQHFPSDVFVGSVIGNLVAQNIYTRRHDPELGGTAWESIASRLRFRDSVSSAYMGSPYVPLDSWIYPALERLIAMNYVKTGFLSMRPWTRFECARLVSEAGTRLEGGDIPHSEALETYEALRREFSPDLVLMEGGNNERAQLESVYSRTTGIAGRPLSQGYQYDFGQTLINDFGRPYEEGFNNVTGFSGWATEGFLTAYVRGEYQHSPSAPALPLGVRQFIGTSQQLPEPPAQAFGAQSQFQLLDAYVGLTVDNWQISFGRQSLWWGPGEGGSMMLGDNAAPIDMLRVDRVSPFKLPSFLGYLGPMRFEFFLGQLSGQDFVFGESTGAFGSWTSSLGRQPMIDGEHFSFKPTANLEFGLSLTSLFGGGTVPFTSHTYIKSIFALGNALPGSPQDPGDRRTGFDFSYRLPWLRNWVTFYADGFAEDQFSPLAYWDRSAWLAGIYVSHLPKIPKLDLRLEGVFTDLPAGGALSHGFFYWNDRYRNGYTNDGYLLGSWVGRQGQGAQAWSTYHFGPRTSLQGNFRHQKISQQFLPGGGSLTDIGVKYDFQARPDLAISAAVQGERWLIPVIAPGAQRNLTTSIQITYLPVHWGRGSKD